jgi:hypothetical protein
MNAIVAGSGTTLLAVWTANPVSAESTGAAAPQAASVVNPRQRHATIATLNFAACISTTPLSQHTAVHDKKGEVGHL